MVKSDLVCHPGPTMGFRISEDHSTVAYLPDHEVALGVTGFPDLASWTSGMALASEADLLFHDSQYDEEEYADRIGWGHSTPRHSATFARIAGVKRLVTFHHDPNHNDVRLDAMLEDAATLANGVTLQGGKEGDTFEI
jgi:ribonuclease BN (tRNA processing enzyme)